MAERLRQAIAAHAFSGGLSMTASFGVSVVSDADSVDAVLLRADRLLYVAKESGRDLVVTRCRGPDPPVRDPGNPVRDPGNTGRGFAVTVGRKVER